MYEYQKDKEYRARKMREADNRRQAGLAQPGSSAGFHWQPSLQTTRRLALAVILVVLFILSALVLPQIARAQDIRDGGNGEAYADAMVAYRMGRYYFARENYERAIARYEEAIECIPPEAFEAIPGYANIYWDLGDALLMAGQHGEALVSYQRYLDVAGEEASPRAIEFVERLEDGIGQEVVNLTPLTS